MNPEHSTSSDITKTYSNREITRERPCGCLEARRLHPLQSVLDAVDPGLSEHVQTENSVEPLPNGPLLVNVTQRVKGANGRETLENKVTAFCRCGVSRNKPYCDGLHARIGFQE